MLESNSKTTEELIALEESQKVFGDHRDQFFEDIKAVADDEAKTKAIYIFWAYLKWCTFNKIEPLNRRHFFHGMTRFFKQKKTRRNYYYVRSTAFNISKKEKKLMDEHLKEEHAFEKRRKLCRKMSKASIKSRRKSGMLKNPFRKKHKKNRRRKGILLDSQD